MSVWREPLRQRDQHERERDFIAYLKRKLAEAEARIEELEQFEDRVVELNRRVRMYEYILDSKGWRP